MTLAGCGFQPLDEVDEIFSHAGDGRRVLCATNLDTIARNDLTSIRAGMDRAAARGEVIHLYAHAPGRTVPVDKIEAVLDAAVERGLRWVTYDDLAQGAGEGPGIALSFDDNNVASWTAIRPQLQAAGARATFFVSRLRWLDDDQRAELRALAGDGHDLEAHTVNHLNAPDYVESHGLHAYLRDEAVPSIEGLRDEGFPVRAFAYPFGARTRELDRALLSRVGVLRSVTFTAEVPAVSDPCPEP